VYRSIIPSEAQVIMTYNLNVGKTEGGKRVRTWTALKKLVLILAHEKRNLFIALFIILINSSLYLMGPFLIGHAIDNYVQTRQYHGVMVFSGILLSIYLTNLFTGYFQTKLMGGVGQRLLYNLRNAVFSKLQELPIAFFNENKAGDLISRINNDTEKPERKEPCQYRQSERRDPGKPGEFQGCCRF